MYLLYYNVDMDCGLIAYRDTYLFFFLFAVTQHRGSSSVHGRLVSWFLAGIDDTLGNEQQQTELSRLIE